MTKEDKRWDIGGEDNRRGEVWKTIRGGIWGQGKRVQETGYRARVDFGS